MIKLNKNSKIYILCPAGIETGGPESVHLLCETLLKRGFDCNIIYLAHSYPGGKGHPGHGPIDRSDVWQEYIVTENCKPKSYEVYTTKCTDSIEDDSNNLLITLEIFTNALEKYNNIQKSVWWLASRIGDDNTYEENNWFKFSENPNVYHFYNSNFAEFMMFFTGAQYFYRLQTYVNTDYEKYSNVEKSNIIAYNPKKGMEHLSKVIMSSPKGKGGFTFVPIENLSREEVKELLSNAKVYIDFGHHPGRERLPREAVLSGCCIITGFRGSARFHQDVPIPNEYKFDCNNLDIQGIIKLIKDCFDNYDIRSRDFETHKRTLLNNKKQFNIDVDNIFGRNI